MKFGKINFLMDGQWGSCGKGKFAAWLADQNAVTASCSSNMPNAGHTVEKDGQRVIFKCLPAASMAVGMQDLYLSAASVIDIDRLSYEIKAAKIEQGIFIHDRAMILQPHHVAAEMSSTSMRKIASTMQGCGEAMAEKLRRFESVTARSHQGELEKIGAVVLSDKNWRTHMKDRLNRGEAVLHEISQGFALSIDHGSHYPQCTSRNCSVQSAINDIGLPLSDVGDVYMVVRPYPIRVGNLYDKDRTEIGHSGFGYDDCHEITWNQIGKLANMPSAEIDRLHESEKTTVTRRLRRPFTFSKSGFVDAVQSNGATHLIVNFAQYLDFSINRWSGHMRLTSLPNAVREFIGMLRHLAPMVHVAAIGTGSDHRDVITLEY